MIPSRRSAPAAGALAGVAWILTGCQLLSGLDGYDDGAGTGTASSATATTGAGGAGTGGAGTGGAGTGGDDIRTVALFSGKASSLVVGSSDVYWATKDDGVMAGAIWSAPIQGGPSTPRRIVNNVNAAGLAVSDGSIFWSDTVIQSAPAGATDASPSNQYANDPTGAGATTLLYDPSRPQLAWMEPSYFHLRWLDGSNVKGVLGATVTRGAMALDSGWVYWQAPSGILRVDKDGDNVGVVVVLDSTRISAIATDQAEGGYIYWTNPADGQLQRALKPVGVQPGQIDDLLAVTSPSAILVDSLHVYWVEGAACDGSASLHRADLPDMAGQRVLATGLSCPLIAQDGVHVFYADNGTSPRIMRIPKQ